MIKSKKSITSITLLIFVLTTETKIVCMEQEKKQSDYRLLQLLTPSKTTMQSAGKKLMAGLIAFLILTSKGLAQETKPSAQLDSPRLPICTLNQTRIAAAVAQAEKTGNCTDFCSFPYYDAYFNCQPNEYHMAACANKNLQQALPQTLVTLAASPRKTSLDFFIYPSTDKNETDIRYLQYPNGLDKSNIIPCIPFDKLQYDRIVNIARKTGSCQYLCAEPSFDCNKDGGSKLVYPRLYIYTLCPQQAFEIFPAACQEAIKNLKVGDIMAMGFLWNEFDNGPFDYKKASLLECPLRKKPNTPRKPIKAKRKRKM